MNVFDALKDKISIKSHGIFYSINDTYNVFSAYYQDGIKLLYVTNERKRYGYALSYKQHIKQAYKDENYVYNEIQVRTFHYVLFGI